MRSPYPKARLGDVLVHPGRILQETILWPFYISQNALARAMGVPPRRINEIVLGKRAITVDTALGLERVIGLSAHYWMALQADYDIESSRNAWEASNRCFRVPPASTDILVDLGMSGREALEELASELERLHGDTHIREILRNLDVRFGTPARNEDGM